MPTFSSDIDLDIDEFFSSCNRDEKNELAELVIDEGLASPLTEMGRYSSLGVQHDAYVESLNRLSSLYFKLSLEEIEAVIQLSKKY